VVGLGFEDRTPASFDRLLSLIAPARVLAVRYDNAGHGDAMREAAQKRGIRIEEIDYAAVASGQTPELSGRVLVDVTGLAKPALFGFVRSGLRASGELL